MANPFDTLKVITRKLEVLQELPGSILYITYNAIP
ncbi:hypothetical protein SAMN05421788_101469 [Filimonas lacunae]|uniref:Uncharacterized protein n=1 Tax=Filimonas lacunae TaxID=477680 RepID=A0A1N7KWH1_9BACT|nr:hypothetical protein SAMN05421788_101469 [Filimonas lacunae]